MTYVTKEWLWFVCCCYGPKAWQPCMYVCECGCVYKSQALSISCKLTCKASSLPKTLDTRTKYISRFWIFRDNFIFWYHIHLSPTMGKKISLNFTYLFCVFLKHVRCGQYLYQNITIFPYTELNSNGLRKLISNDSYEEWT